MDESFSCLKTSVSSTVMIWIFYCFSNTRRGSGRKRVSFLPINSLPPHLPWKLFFLFDQAHILLSMLNFFALIRRLPLSVLICTPLINYCFSVGKQLPLLENGLDTFQLALIIRFAGWWDRCWVLWVIFPTSTQSWRSPTTSSGGSLVSGQRVSKLIHHVNYHDYHRVNTR